MQLHGEPVERHHYAGERRARVNPQVVIIGEKNLLPYEVHGLLAPGPPDVPLLQQQRL